MIQPFPVISRKLLAAILMTVLLPAPVFSQQWDALHWEMLDAFAELATEYFVAGSVAAAPPAPVPSFADHPIGPSIIVVGFTGGFERNDSKASGVAAMRRGLEAHLEGLNGEVLPLTFNNLRWRRAVTQVLEAVAGARRKKGPFSGIPQPLIVVYGHSWGAASIGKFARELKKENLEISLAVYIDAFSWRNPRVPDNVRYAVNFYQRAGLFRGLPFRGKSKLIANNPQTTHIFGSYRIQPQTDFWGWSWDLFQPLLYRHHHRISHDPRLQQYLLEIVNLKLALLSHAQKASEVAGARDF